MSVVDDLLKQILSDEKLLGSKAFRDKVSVSYTHLTLPTIYSV